MITTFELHVGWIQIHSDHTFKALTRNEYDCWKEYANVDGISFPFHCHHIALTFRDVWTCYFEHSFPIQVDDCAKWKTWHVFPHIARWTDDVKARKILNINTTLSLNLLRTNTTRSHYESHIKQFRHKFWFIKKINWIVI